MFYTTIQKQKKNISHLSEKGYYQPFIQAAPSEKNKIKLELALERAWRNRDYEIDKYWSRATYFWAFIAATFAGYIAVISSIKLDAEYKNELAFIIICLGVIFSSAWVMVNLGSKMWQENWEKHIDMLEDYVTGPIYKTVWNKTSYSVSKINIIVSKFVTTVWMFLAIVQAFILPCRNRKENEYVDFDWIIFLIALITLLNNVSSG